MSWFSVMVCSLALPILVGGIMGLYRRPWRFPTACSSHPKETLVLGKAYSLPCRVDSFDVVQPSGLPFFQCDAVSGLALAVPAASFASAAGKNDRY